MKIIDWNNQQQKEAILNECKGNLFEFLVTAELARETQHELNFLEQIPHDFRLALKEYESILRKYEPDLLTSLVMLSKATSKKILKFEKIENNKFKDWILIGKMAGISHDDLWYETDILGLTEDNKKYYLSLKLSKSNSFTNTKSAGAKSFVAKYFSSFRSSKNNQEEFNNYVDMSFDLMGDALYRLVDKKWQGRFDSNWSNFYSELPGELNNEQNEIVLANYYRLSKKLYTILISFYEEDSVLFLNSLKRLCGFGDDEIIQVNCFHQNDDLKEIKIYSVEDIFKREQKIFSIANEKSSIEIDLGSNVLQIRIKPMNKFTTASYKINCSIKEKGRCE